MNKSITTLVLLGFTGAAFAQGLPAFEEVDANGDGLISAEEAAAIEGFDFAAADADQDGSLSRDEYEAAQSE